MSIPTVGMYRTDDHRYYWNGDGPKPSVTTAMKTYDKSEVLMGWAKRETAAFAVRNLDLLTTHRDHASRDPLCVPCQGRRAGEDPTAAAQRWVASIPGYQSDAARDLGTEVHAIAEAIAKGEEPDVIPAFLPYAKSYQAFLDEVRPDILAIEYMGLNRAHDYAGTGDIILRIGGLVTVVDIKTHTKPTPLPDTYYPETAFQLAACGRFDFIGKPNDPTEYPMPRVDAYGVLLLGASGYRLIRYWVTDATFEGFLACLTLYRWRVGEARTVVADPEKKEAA